LPLAENFKPRASCCNSIGGSSRLVLISMKRTCLPVAQATCGARGWIAIARHASGVACENGSAFDCAASHSAQP
jgi:hypothetical protein